MSWCHSPEDTNLHSYRCENSKFCNYVYGGLEVELYAFLAWALYGGKNSVSQQLQQRPMKISGSRRQGGCVGRRVDPDALEKQKRNLPLVVARLTRRTVIA